MKEAHKPKLLTPLIAIGLILTFPATAMASSKPCNSDKPPKASTATVTQPTTVQPKPTTSTTQVIRSSTSTSTTIKEKKPCSKSTTTTTAVQTPPVNVTTTTVRPAIAAVTSTTLPKTPEALPDDSIARSGSDAIGVPVEIAQPVGLTKASAASELPRTGFDSVDLAFAGTVFVVLGAAVLEARRMWLSRRDTTLEDVR